MSKAFDISFVVPVYNSEPFLRRCLDSIFSQKEISFEVIIVDDCSPGNCGEIVREYDSSFGTIVYLRHAVNRGLMQARLTGLDVVRGSYVIHVDSDDWVSGDVAQKALRAAKKYHADVVHFGAYWGTCNEDMRPHFGNREYFLKGREILDKFFDGELWWTQWGKLYKTSVLKEAYQRFPVDRSKHVNSLEDLALSLPIIFTARIYVCSEQFGSYFYFNNPSSMTKRLVDAPGRWSKLCVDMGNVRKFYLEWLRAVDAPESDIHRMESLFHKKNYEWAFKLTAGLSINTRVERLKILNKECSPAMIVDLVGPHDFDVLASSLPYEIGENRTKEVKSICIISETLRGGGAERASAQLGEIFIRAGYEVHIVTDEPPMEGDYFVCDKIRRASISGKRSERWRDLQSLVRQGAIDLCIHVSHYRERMMYDILALRGHCYNVAVEHSMFFFPFYKPDIDLFSVRKTAYRFIDALVCLSEANRVWWLSSGVKQTYVIPNPLTFNAASIAESACGVSKNILFVGRICEMKGAIRALHLFREVLILEPEAKLLMLGSFGSDLDKAEVDAFIAEHHLEKFIEFTGYVSDVSSYLRNARVHVLTSLVEGAPMVLNEAKSYGVPSVILGLSYLDNIGISSGAPCFERNNFEEAAVEIARLLKDFEYWKAMSLSAKASLSSANDESVLKGWQQVISEVSSDKPKNMVSSAGNVLDMTMMELLEGLEYSRKSSKVAEVYLPHYLVLLNDYLNRLLPLGTSRRKIVKKFFRNGFLMVLAGRRRFKEGILIVRTKFFFEVMKK